MSIIIYGLQRCDTCKKTRRWLDAAGITHTFIDYRDSVPAPDLLNAWAAQRGGFNALINKASTTWRQLPENLKTPANNEAWLSLLSNNPALIRRPVLVMENGIIHQGFSEDRYKTLFSKRDFLE